MKDLHSLLQEQLSAHPQSEALKEILFPLLETISDTYQQQENDRQQLLHNLKQEKQVSSELQGSLEKVNKELDRFVYSVSHDLRAPMASLLGLLNIAEQEEDTAALQQYRGLMRNSVIRMERFITNLLNFSSSSRLGNIPELVDFKAMADEISSNLRHLPNAFQIDFIQELKLDDPFYCDQHKLGIILTNLISNAIQYHNFSQQRPFVRLFVEGTTEQAIITLQDNGQGIDKAYHEKIFDMFFRGNSTSSGNGLGLYIVKETVQKLNGSIEFSSAAGKGTSFTITLPNMRKPVEDESLATTA